MRSNRILIALALSFVIHSVLVLSISQISTLAPKKQSITIELIHPPPPAKTQVQKNQKTKIEIDKQIVEQNEQPMNNEIPDDTKFFSAHNQKIKKQTVARNKGEFKNIHEKKISPRPLSAQVDPPIVEKPKAFNPLSDLDDHFREKQLKNIAKNPEDRPVIQPSPNHSSQTQDYLKSVDPGFETLLSTKEYKYYTYFNRIRRQLSQHWEPKVRNRLTRMFRQGRVIASDQDKITRLLIILNISGQLVKVQILSDSGVRDLDEAAIEAFQSAAPFPNPPKGIVDSDGTVKIRWDFILES